MKYFINGFIFALFLIIGCGNDIIVEEHQDVYDMLEDIGFIPIVYPPDANISILINNAKTEEDQNEIIQQYVEIMRIIGNMENIIESTESWEEVHRQIKIELLKNNTHIFSSFMEQVIANKMLKHHILNNNQAVSIERQKAAGFYTDILLRNNNPNAYVIFPALKLLNGYWPDEKIVKSSDDVLIFSTQYLNRHKFLERSGVDYKSLDQLEDAKQRVLHKIYYAIPELEQMKKELE